MSKVSLFAVALIAVTMASPFAQAATKTNSVLFPSTSARAGTLLRGAFPRTTPPVTSEPLVCTKRSDGVLVCIGNQAQETVR
jgi:hypothetical protein